MSVVRAVILDIDGTLIDSNDAHAHSYVDAAREQGIEAEYGRIRRLIGKGGDKLIPEVFGFEKESPEGKRLDERKGEIFREVYLPTLQPTPGTRELLERLRDRGLTLVVATSAGKDDLKGLLERAGVGDLIQEATSASDVEESKPEPDVVEAALKQAGQPAEAALMIGDTPYDVEAATRAGVRIIAVRSGGWGDEDLGGAVAVFDHPADLLSRLQGSPLAAKRGGPLLLPAGSVRYLGVQGKHSGTRRERSARGARARIPGRRASGILALPGTSSMHRAPWQTRRRSEG